MNKKENKNLKNKQNFSKSKEIKKLEESYKIGIKYYKEVDEQEK